MPKPWKGAGWRAKCQRLIELVLQEDWAAATALAQDYKDQLASQQSTAEQIGAQQSEALPVGAVSAADWYATAAGEADGDDGQ